MDKTVLVIGSGGREHALCWKLAQSPNVTRIYCAPGNGGTATMGKTQNVSIGVQEFEVLARFAQEHAVNLVVVGPDNPLADGIVDVFQAHGIPTFGPTRDAAQLEGSKAFAKQFMKTHGLPTARFDVFELFEDALTFCRENPWARVIKADGLALGKGVFVCDTVEACEQALSEIFKHQRFGTAGSKVVIEERLNGPEISLMMFCDGKTLLPLSPSQDYKRRFEGNKGPNTGGMGVYSPVPQFKTYALAIQETIINPLQQALQHAPFTFKGLLYAGLLIHNDTPYILEFNARFGDPETQCLMPRLQNHVDEVMMACIEGRLEEITLDWSKDASVCVVATADSYPEQGSKDQPISIGKLPESVTLFHAGTKVDANGQLLTQGGRVLNVVALGADLDQTRNRAYDALKQIHFNGMAYRMDIAKDVTPCLSK